MRNTLVTALLVSIAAGVVSAQFGGSSGSGAHEIRYEAASTKAPGSFGDVTDIFRLGPPIAEQPAFRLSAAISEPTGPGMNLWQPGVIVVDEEVGEPFPDTQNFEIHADALFRELDLLRATNSAPSFHFGVNNRFKFAEYGDKRPGLRAPVGASYLWGRHRLEVFAEFGPMLDAMSTTSLEWSGGVGIRFYLGR